MSATMSLRSGSTRYIMHAAQYASERNRVVGDQRKSSVGSTHCFINHMLPTLQRPWLLHPPIIIIEL
jgi:hypothetical protein